MTILQYKVLQCTYHFCLLYFLKAKTFLGKYWIYVLSEWKGGDFFSNN